MINLREAIVKDLAVYHAGVSNRHINLSIQAQASAALSVVLGISTLCLCVVLGFGLTLASPALSQILQAVLLIGLSVIFTTAYVKVIVPLTARKWLLSSGQMIILRQGTVTHAYYIEQLANLQFATNEAAMEVRAGLFSLFATMTHAEGELSRLMQTGQAEGDLDYDLALLSMRDSHAKIEKFVSTHRSNGRQ